MKDKQASILQRGYSLSLVIPPTSVDQALIKLLYELLNRYNRIFFITIQGVPACLLPGASDHVVAGISREHTCHRIPACKMCVVSQRCPGWPVDIPLSFSQTPSIQDLPAEIVMEITGQCNLSCGYCTNMSRRHGHVSFRKLKRIMDEARRCRIPAVRFTGGEPLLHPEALQILSYAKSSGFYVLVNTNATLTNPEVLRLLSRTTDNVLVSLQGFNQASDQALTHSEFPFVRKIQNIFLLRSYVPTLRLGSVMTPSLLKNWPRYVALIKRLRPHTWELFRPMSGQDKLPDNVTLKDYQRLCRKIVELKRENLNVKLANALPFCILKDRDLAASIMLGAASDDGHSRLVWDARGFFKPSYFIDKNLGNTIRRSWQHPFLKKMRQGSYLPTLCRQCSHLAWCRGGSRAKAYAWSGSYFDADPLMREKPIEENDKGRS